MSKKTKADSAVRPFGMLDKIGYALGDTGCGFSFQLVATYMQLFYCQCIGIKLQHYAIIILISKAWDAVNDVLIGNMVDTKRIGKKSKYKPWIFIGSVLLVVLTVAIFAPVQSLPYQGKVAWCLLSYCLWSVAYTMVNVPYGSLHSVISDDPKARTSLSTFRSIGAALPAVIVMILPQFVYKRSETAGASEELDPNALLIISLVLSIAALAALIGTTKLVTERVVRTQKASDQKQSSGKLFISAFGSFFKNRPMVGATLATVASVTFFNSTMSVNNLVFQYFFNDAKKASLATIGSYLPMVVVMLFIGKLVAKNGKKKVVSVGTLISAAAGLVLLFVPMQANLTGMIIYVVGLMFVNTGNCIFQVSVWAIVADCIEISYRKTGKSEEGSLYALYSFFRKLSQGIGQAVVSLGLGIIGFVEGTGAVQPENFGSRVKVLYLFFLSFGTLITFLCMKFIYNIGKKEEEAFHTDAAQQITPEDI